jgi:hypothetical protein
MILSHNLHEILLAFLFSTPLSRDEYVSKLKTVKTKVMETNVLHTSYPMHFLGTLGDLEGRDAQRHHFYSVIDVYTANMKHQNIVQYFCFFFVMHCNKIV